MDCNEKSLVLGRLFLFVLTGWNLSGLFLARIFYKNQSLRLSTAGRSESTLTRSLADKRNAVKTSGSLTREISWLGRVEKAGV